VTSRPLDHLECLSRLMDRPVTVRVPLHDWREARKGCAARPRFFVGPEEAPPPRVLRRPGSPLDGRSPSPRPTPWFFYVPGRGKATRVARPDRPDRRTMARNASSTPRFLDSRTAGAAKKSGELAVIVGTLTGAAREDSWICRTASTVASSRTSARRPRLPRTRGHRLQNGPPRRRLSELLGSSTTAPDRRRGRRGRGSSVMATRLPPPEGGCTGSTSPRLARSHRRFPVVNAEYRDWVDAAATRTGRLDETAGPAAGLHTLPVHARDEASRRSSFRTSRSSA